LHLVGVIAECLERMQFTHFQIDDLPSSTGRGGIAGSGGFSGHCAGASPWWEQVFRWHFYFGTFCPAWAAWPRRGPPCQPWPGAPAGLCRLRRFFFTRRGGLRFIRFRRAASVLFRLFSLRIRKRPFPFRFFVFGNGPRHVTGIGQGLAHFKKCGFSLVLQHDSRLGGQVRDGDRARHIRRGGLGVDMFLGALGCRCRAIS
jgi:hypothetical protein